jgi:hypothetical protein
MSEDLEILEQFHDQHADSAVCYRKPDAAQAAELAGRVPDGLIELWQKHGWCSYLGGQFWMVNPLDHDDLREGWRLDDEASIIARSGFGDLVATIGDKVVTIYVHTGRYQPSIQRYDEYLASQFSEDDIEELFFGDLHKQAVAAHGEPGETEIFTFEQPIARGGATELSNVRRAGLKPTLLALWTVHDRLVRY